MRPNPEFLTEKTPPAPHQPAADQDGPDHVLSAGDAALLDACGIDDLGALAGQCQRLRRELGKPAGRWSAERLLDVLRQAVLVRGHPAHLAAGALRTLAADPATHSPMRLPCPGPWWTAADSASQLQRVRDARSAVELDALEARLLEADGRRIWAQQRARDDLAARGEPLTRLAVARRACHLLDQAETTPC